MNFDLKLDLMYKAGIVCILLAGGFLTIYLSTINGSKGVGGMMLIMLFGDYIWNWTTSRKVLRKFPRVPMQC